MTQSETSSHPSCARAGAVATDGGKTKRTPRAPHTSQGSVLTIRTGQLRSGVVTERHPLIGIESFITTHRRSGQEAAAVRRHDLTGKKGETQPRELPLRGLEQEQEVECVGPRTGVVLDGDPEPAAGKRDHTGFRPVRRWCGARCSRSARAGAPRRSARSRRVLDRERCSTESRHAVAISLRPSRVPQDPVGPRPRRSHERPRPPRSRELQDLPRPMGYGCFSDHRLGHHVGSRSRHLRNRTDPETTYVKARNARTRRVASALELSMREVDR